MYSLFGGLSYFTIPSDYKLSGALSLILPSLLSSKKKRHTNNRCLFFHLPCTAKSPQIRNGGNRNLVPYCHGHFLKRKIWRGPKYPGLHPAGAIMYPPMKYHPEFPSWRWWWMNDVKAHWPVCCTCDSVCRGRRSSSGCRRCCYCCRWPLYRAHSSCSSWGRRCRSSSGSSMAVIQLRIVCFPKVPKR